MGRRIVVVEDEELIAASVAARLRAEGFEVSIAGDGPGGVALCAEVQPDLVVLDLMLPAGTSPASERVRRCAEYAPGRIRTCGLALRRRALYPLSYGRSAAESTVRRWRTYVRPTLDVVSRA